MRSAIIEFQFNASLVFNIDFIILKSYTTYVATYIVTVVQEHLKLISNRLWLNTCRYVLC